MPLNLRQDPLGLYLHIPFCERQCHFCAFFTRGYRDERAATFVEDLLAEIRLYGQSCRLRERWVETMYFGGGTPTTLSAEQLGEIVQACRAAFRVELSVEMSIEANPASTTEDSLAKLRRAGFNRLSFGAQSFDDGELNAIGSPHTVGDITHAVHAARRTGFKNINLDLIYGLPGQSLERLKANLARVTELEPQHISLYGFTLEEGTRFAREAERGRLVHPSEELMAEMYQAGRDVLHASGYLQYEVSNFARPGCACRHNLGYWTDREWLGLGPSAHSYLDGERFWNADSLEEYHDRLMHKNLPVTDRETGDAELRWREAIVFGLRSVEGVKLKSLASRYGVVPGDHFRDSLDRLLDGGWLELDDDILRPTRAGLAVADELAMAFL